jgi:NFU1 iron-sulfur cluster scaffold homolog, mitochondrial
MGCAQVLVSVRYFAQMTVFLFSPRLCSGKFQFRSFRTTNLHCLQADRIAVNGAQNSRKTAPNTPTTTDYHTSECPVNIYSKHYHEKQRTLYLNLLFATKILLMENTVTQSPVMLYTEQTPNPEALKFVTNRLLYRGIVDFNEKALAEQWSPMANSLMELAYVKTVYFNNNYLTITKEFNYEWSDIMLKLKEFIKNYIEQGGTIILDGFEAHRIEIEQAQSAALFSGEDGELSLKIKDLIDTYVKPAIEVDGGNIEFKRYEAGKVYVIMQGSCSGCPSSSVTLKSGIEGMLKRMVPEVQEVVQEMA